MRLKVGTKVQICDTGTLRDTGYIFGINSDMWSYCGKTAIITRIEHDLIREYCDIYGYDCNIYYLDIDDGKSMWANLQLIPTEPLITIF